ncbi:hypothetical protein [Pseudomonas sp. PDM20]|uniref:hypothetical protein n=1 Tax=Pseudomonas sp. PDM20 TaxID=2769254 RepID=UPI001785C7D8|nr:hypothetical protein [Pseudomonas sp. PDM20]MBD9686672.1 hypothetical protein [Pseudomonas sp. PDM20]
MPIFKRFIHNSGKLEINPIIRTETEFFSTTVLKENAKRRSSATINTNFYDISASGYISALKGHNPTPASETTFLGEIVSEGKIVGGKPEPLNFYIAHYKDRHKANIDLTTTFSTGQGNPPGDCSCGFGGLGPLIINGLPYGSINKYSSEADSLPESLRPIIGEPSTEAKKFLTQRSSAKFTSFSKNDSNYSARLGKTCLGIRSLDVCVYVQKHGDSGMSIEAVRDEMMALGCKHAVFFDGSDSSLLYTPESGFLVSQADAKDQTCIAGAAFYWHSEPSQREPENKAKIK